MPGKNHVIQRRRSASALTLAVSLLLAGCSGGSPAHSAALGGGASGNPACTAAAKAYSSFLAGYTPEQGGDWETLSTALEQALNSGNENTQLGLDIFGLSQDAAGFASDISQGGGDGSVGASSLQPFDDDLQTVAKDCGITLTSPQPWTPSS